MITTDKTSGFHRVDTWRRGTSPSLITRLMCFAFFACFPHAVSGLGIWSWAFSNYSGVVIAEDIIHQRAIEQPGKASRPRPQGGSSATKVPMEGPALAQMRSMCLAASVHQKQTLKVRNSESSDKLYSV